MQFPCASKMAVDQQASMTSKHSNSGQEIKIPQLKEKE